jgi:Cohesin domain
MKCRNLLRFLLSIFALIGGVFVSTAAIVTFDSPSNISEGQVFDIKVIIDPQGAAMGGVQMDFRFDEANIQVTSIIEGNLFKHEGTATLFNAGTINNSNGSIKNVFIAILKDTNESTQEYVSTQGIFIIINAKANIPLEVTPINYTNVIIVDIPQNQNQVYPVPTNSQTSSGDEISVVTMVENYTNIDSREKSYSQDYEKNQEPATIGAQEQDPVVKSPGNQENSKEYISFVIFGSIMMISIIVYKNLLKKK